MKKLIEMHQEHLVVCDNTKCDFTIPNKTDDPNLCGKEYLNVACPKCGENLLTEKDYITALKTMSVINWLNKWFSWLTIFTKEKNRSKTTIKTHKGISIEVEK